MNRLWPKIGAAASLLWALTPLLKAEMATRRWGTPPAGPPSAKVKTPRPKPPTCYVPKTTGRPKLDGKLDDDVWRKATMYRLGRTLAGSTNIAQPTEVRLLRDDRTLYVAFRCTEPLLGKLRAPRRGHDGPVWQDDSVEIFISPGGTYYQYGINAVAGTYDSHVKDASWNSGFQAAAGREPDAWTLEIAIPLAKMRGQGKGPVVWTVNFTRNRHAAGQREEMTWSPTYSDNSHAPGWFGKMLFKDPPEKPKRPVVKKGAVTILPAQGGQGVVRFDLSDLTKGTRVYRADLLIFRTARVAGRMPEALIDIEIHPLFSKFDGRGRPNVSGKPLRLRAPWYDRFDVTEAVRKWVSGRDNGGFFVKACPFWNAKATCLDVAYEGKAEGVPQQVAGVKAAHRAGQTFLTWKEVDPLITTDETTWGEIRRKLSAGAAACRYRIYQHAKPITAANLHEGRLLGEVGPLSAYNVNARNKEYLIGRAMVESDEMGELARDYNGYMHKWTMDHPRMDRYPVRRFVIDEKAGPLPVGTGLYVHTAASPGRRHYAVVTAVNGVENTRDIAPANAPRQAVTETVGPPRPVRQGRGIWGPYFDYPGTRWVYVQWCAPPLAPRPNMYFNWSVLIPPKVKPKAPAELYFHPSGYSYAQPGKKMLLDSIQIAAHDHPPSGWYGFNDAWGTLKSYASGVVRDHTQRRILAFLEWARGRFDIDGDRILAVGSDGAAALALDHRDVFSYVLITRFDRAGVLEPKAAGKFADAWGPKSRRIQDQDGRSEWRWADLDLLALANPGSDLPLFVCRGPSWGHVKGWGKGRGRFYSAMHKAGQPLVAHWAWGGKLERPDKYTGLWRGLGIHRNSALPAFAKCSLDVEGEGSGNTNAGFSWKDIRDTPDGFEVTILSRPCTFDMTPRRLRRFRVKPGQMLQWVAAPLPDRRGKKAAPQSGQVKVDSDGIVTLRGLSIPRESPGVNVKIARAK